MRKVIPYIASQFRKDRIWLRRTKPAQRNYQIVLAVDDSSRLASLIFILEQILTWSTRWTVLVDHFLLFNWFSFDFFFLQYGWQPVQRVGFWISGFDQQSPLSARSRPARSRLIRRRSPALTSAARHIQRHQRTKVNKLSPVLFIVDCRIYEMILDVSSAESCSSLLSSRKRRKSPS